MDAFLEFVRENEPKLCIETPLPEPTHKLLKGNIAEWVEKISENARTLQPGYPDDWPPLVALVREYEQSLQCIEWSELMGRLRAFVPRVFQVIRAAREKMDTIVCFLVPAFHTTKSNLLFTEILCALMAREDDQVLPDFVVRNLSTCHRLGQTATSLSSRFIVLCVDDMIFSGQQMAYELENFTRVTFHGRMPLIEFCPLVPFVTTRGREALEVVALSVDYMAINWLDDVMTHVDSFGERLLRARLFDSAEAMNAFCELIAANYKTTDDMQSRMRVHLYGQFFSSDGLLKPPLIMEHKIADFKSISVRIMLRAFYIASDNEPGFIALVTGSDEDEPFYKKIKWTWRGKVTDHLDYLTTTSCVVCDKPAIYACTCKRAFYCSKDPRHCQSFHWSVLGHADTHNDSK